MNPDPRGQEEFDDRFAQIVKGLQDEVAGPDDTDEPDGDSRPPPSAPGISPASNPTTSWWSKPAPDPDPHDTPAPDPHDQDGDADPLAELPSSWRVPTGGYSVLPDEDDDEFVPPEPDPLPRDDVQFWAILVSLVGGPLWVLYLALFDPMARTLWWVLAVGTCVAGVVLLVLRQPHSDDLEDEDDFGPP